MSTVTETQLQKPAQRAYTTQQVAETLGVCEETVYRLIARKLLRKLPGLRHVRVSEVELARYLATGGVK